MANSGTQIPLLLRPDEGYVGPSFYNPAATDKIIEKGDRFVVRRTYFDEDGIEFPQSLSNGATLQARNIYKYWMSEMKSDEELEFMTSLSDTGTTVAFQTSVLCKKSSHAKSQKLRRCYQCRQEFLEIFFYSHLIHDHSAQNQAYAYCPLCSYKTSNIFSLYFHTVAFHQ